jgi:AraC-like DNA-binding protein
MNKIDLRAMNPPLFNESIPLVLRDMDFVSVAQEAEPHAHSDVCEFHLFIRGEGSFTTQAKSLYTIPIKVGSLFFSLPDETHRIVRKESAPALSLYYIRFDSQKSPHGEELIHQLRKVLPINKSMKLGESYRFFLEEMKQRFHSRDPFLVKAAEHQLLTLIYDLLGGGQISDFKKGTHIDKAIELIQNSIYQTLSLTDISEEVGIDKFHLVRLFKRKTGSSPMSYFQRLKIETAKYLLKQTDSSIRVISEELRFSDPFHFSRAFKQHCGITPHLYRESGEALSLKR